MRQFDCRLSCAELDSERRKRYLEYRTPKAFHLNYSLLGYFAYTMNIFFEFHKIAMRLQERDIPYALIGGVAMAFHTRPRFTKDIDLLVTQDVLEDVAAVLTKENYSETASPWTFKDTSLTLHRYLKVEDEDEMMIDVLVAGDLAHRQMIDRAEIVESETLGQIRVVRREDLIDLKRARDSKLDQADIEELESDED